MALRCSTCVFAVGLVSGCSSEERPEATTSPGSIGDNGTGISMDEESSGDEEAGDETGDRLDVSGGGTGMAEGGDLNPDACKKVDLLFVIDGSGSMADEQANLIAAFPGFINTMQTELSGTEGYNVGVVRTDANDISCVAGRYGVLVTRNLAAESSNMVCDPYASGGRYMNQDDDLAVKFACAARVGTGGDGDEKPMQALGAALTSPNTDPGECNEGFLRDDALLVVVIITDEEDDHETEAEACNMTALPGSAGAPNQWFDTVVGAKDGIETNVVVLSLVGPTGADACPALDKCNGGIAGAEPATRIIEFTNMFTHGFVGPVCGDYDPFFQEAVGTIKSACDDFTPPG